MELKEKLKRKFNFDIKDETLANIEQLINSSEEVLRDIIRYFVCNNYAYVSFLMLYENDNNKRTCFDILELIKNIKGSSVLKIFIKFIDEQYFYQRVDGELYYSIDKMIRLLTSLSELDFEEALFIERLFDDYEDVYKAEPIDVGILTFIIALTEYLVENPDMRNYVTVGDYKHPSNTWDLEGLTSIYNDYSVVAYGETSGGLDLDDMEEFAEEDESYTKKPYMAYKVAFCDSDFETQGKIIYLEDSKDLYSDFKKLISEFMEKEKELVRIRRL